VLNKAPAISFSENFINEDNYKPVLSYLQETQHSFLPVLKNLRMIALFQ
jgi:hypothetical protein